MWILSTKKFPSLNFILNSTQSKHTIAIEFKFNNQNHAIQMFLIQVWWLQLSYTPNCANVKSGLLRHLMRLWTHKSGNANGVKKQKILSTKPKLDDAKISILNLDYWNLKEYQKK